MVHRLQRRREGTADILFVVHDKDAHQTNLILAAVELETQLLSLPPRSHMTR
jgi:hypothetical protein